MYINQKRFGILLFALTVLTTTTFLLFADKKAKYDEYDRLMW
jgi:hypothetical protein